MNGANYEVPHCGAFSTRHSHPSWAQIFASGFCFQIPHKPLRSFILATCPAYLLDLIALSIFGERYKL